MIDKESLRLEYRLSQEMHNYYGKIQWQIGSILITASLAGFAFGIQQDLPHPQFVPLAIGLTLLLLMFFLIVRRHRWLGHIHLARCKEIEKILGMKQHTLESKANENTITIGEVEIKPQLITGWDINKIILFLLIIVFWIGVFRNELSQLIQ